jgi:hypothetical protein
MPDKMIKGFLYGLIGTKIQNEKADGNKAPALAIAPTRDCIHVHEEEQILSHSLRQARRSPPNTISQLLHSALFHYRHFLLKIISSLFWFLVVRESGI